MLLFLVSGLIGLSLFLPSLIDINAYRGDIVTTLQQQLNRRVSFGRGEFSLKFGPTLTFDNLSIGERGGGEFLTARRISVHLALLPLLEKRVVLRSVVVEEADLRLERDARGRLNIHDLLAPRPGAYQLQLRKVQIKGGVLHWRDARVVKGGFQAEARINNLLLDGITPGKWGAVKLECDLPALSGAPGHASLSGAIRLPVSGGPPTTLELDVDADVERFDAGRFWSYYGGYIPFGPFGGRVDLATSFKGTPLEFSAQGRLRLANAAVNWPTVFHHPVNPRLAQLEYKLKRNKNAIDMSQLRFSADGLTVRGSCLVRDITGSDPRITAKASSEPFQLERVRNWIPYGIIADDASRYIEEHIIGGLFRLESGLLDGRVSQIAHMERGTNYNVLRIKGRVERGVLSYGPRVPAFTNIRGGLDLIGKDFVLSGVTALFGDSPFRLEGRITDYPLTTPCRYPFQMEISPQPAEVSWLARLAGAHRLEYGGSSRLVLRGSGMTSSYALSGLWELKQASYSFPGVVGKAVGARNTLSFSSLLTPTATRLNSLTYTLQPLTISATAQLGYAGKPHLAFELQSNQFLCNESFPLIFPWRSYRPKGRVQAHVRGNGNPEEFSAMEYSGSISLNSFSFQPRGNLQPVSDINGVLLFRGSSLETTNITAQYGGSQVSARGRVGNFGNPEAEITLSSPRLQLRDLASVPSRPDAAIHGMSATFSVRDNVYTIRSFSGRLNSSAFTISGSYTGGARPSADLALASRYLDLDELLLLMGGGDGGNGGAGMDLRLKVATEGGSYENVRFGRLSLDLSRDSGVYYIQDLETALYGGRLSAKGRIAPDSARINRYDLNLNLERVDAAQFLQAMDFSREVTGSLYLQGNITGRGSNPADIKRSALGNLRLRLERGKLRKFNALSKVFSILNLSQLLKFQLPDMVHGGMPYNEIRGSFAVRDGIVTTRDLFIRSDAINISVIGTADIVREDMDFTIGVQPLQTVDKVVNRIPVVGWLLTGKDRAVLTAYFEARGKWADPKVRSVSVKSLSKGVLNVFRRVFELPVRLFTDTGEVLLGQ
jgi:uncharacterized protein involved in outer membrane biogenesis